MFFKQDKLFTKLSLKTPNPQTAMRLKTHPRIQTSISTYGLQTTEDSKEEKEDL